jgi:tRNA modification GTPase
VHPELRQRHTDPTPGQTGCRAPGACYNETLAVELTPQGRGAVAVVLAAGPDAVRVVDDLFNSASGRRIADSVVGRIVFGRWGGSGGEEVVICRRAEEQVEVHCHGGVAAAGSVIEALVDGGCRQIAWQEWLRQAMADPVRAAAEIALAEAPTARTAGILLDQLNGALSAAIKNVLDAASRGDWDHAAEAIGAVLAFREVGLHLTTPWRVVLAGVPNVGKSSLINALAGYQRAIVAATPGTTRDVVTLQTAIEGWPVELADTAGLREAESEVESAGVALAGRAAATADLVLMIHDAAAAPAGAHPSVDSNVIRPEFQELRSQLPPTKRMVDVWNKIDLLGESPVRLQGGIRAGSEGPPSSPLTQPLPAGERRLMTMSSASSRAAVLTSAVTGEGIDRLASTIAKTLAPIAPPNGAAVPFCGAQLAALDAGSAAIDRRDGEAVHRALEPLLAT